MERKLKELMDRVQTGKHTKEDLVLLSEIARSALKFMVEKNIPVTPHNYQLWFYTFGNLLTAGKKPTEPEIEKSYQQVCKEFKSPMSLEVLRKIQQRTREILGNSTDILFDSVKNLEEFGEKLELFSKRIENSNRENLEELIKVLTEEIQALRRENTSLTAELKNASRKLAKLSEKIAFHIEHSSLDFLTQVLTRGALERLLVLKLENMKRTGTPFSVIMIDSDNFKEINDRYGHLAGDQVLKTVALVLKMGVREDDVVARYGGDEFTIVVSSTLDEAVRIAERLRREVERLVIVWNSHEIKITASFGIAQARPEDNITTLIHRADRALYLAKKEGGNRVKTERELEES